jgi:hypothetical protein
VGLLGGSELGAGAEQVGGVAAGAVDGAGGAGLGSCAGASGRVEQRSDARARRSDGPGRVVVALTCARPALAGPWPALAGIPALAGRKAGFSRFALFRVRKF